MSISAPFIERPVATTLLTIALGLAGAIAYNFLPVAPLPQVEFPTISVNASLPGASPETMSSSVATPLERQLGHIAGVTEMTSSSTLGSTSVTMQFDLNRNIDAAARDVQAAINASRSQLPANLPSNPNYRKVNPADAPILILALMSRLVDTGGMYDAGSSIIAQKLSQVHGVGQVFVGGGALPAVRVDVNPMLLNNFGLSLENVRTTLSAANANRPKGDLMDKSHAWTLTTTDQLLHAAEYKPLLIAYKNGSAVRLEDVANVTDAVEDIRTAGISDGQPSVSVVVFRQPGANIIDTVDRVYALLPQLQASIPQAIKISVVMDRTTTIRGSVHDVQRTLSISVCLVIMVVFIFLRSPRTTLIPSVAVPVSLVATFGVMYLFGYSVDNLSLMALTIATGFVVDDAIVVIENISRHLEDGMAPMQAALVGAKEIGFTVISISISLIAVFIPILLMGGIVGRLFREFAVTLSVAIAISLLVSLTTTPMMCARLLKAQGGRRHNWMYRASERGFDLILAGYKRSLGWVLQNQPLILLVTLSTIGFTVYLYIIVPKGFFPQQDTGRLTGNIVGDQDASFQSMRTKLYQYTKILGEDPAVESYNAYTGGGGMGGGGSINTGRMFIALKDLKVRKLSADEVIARLRPKLARVPGATLFLQAVQDLRIGGRGSNAQYQYTIQDTDVHELLVWAPRLFQKLRSLPGLADLNTDQQDRGLAAQLVIDRDTASRLGLSTQVVDDTLYDAFGQRPVSVMYTRLNQYHVIMEVEPKFVQNPTALKYIYLTNSSGKQIPLSAFAHYQPSNNPLSVNHLGQFPSVTFSFNLPPGFPLGNAVTEIEEAEREMALPANIHGTFQGTAQAYQASLASEPILVLAAIATVYIVLGILYESFVHPLTILSTLPSAGVGALLALLLFKEELDVISLIGIILLIGIVKKNAIMMIDFALEAERRGKTPIDAIFEACMLRFRPITMTTMAALLGGLPLALGRGVGAEMRRPLGIAIVGGLVFSQMLTLYTTPVVYCYLDRLRSSKRRRVEAGQPRPVEA